MKFLPFAFMLLLFTNCYVYKPLELEEDQKKPPITSEIKKDQFYQIVSADKTYKIKAVKWEGDSLVAHVNMKEKNEVKFHKNDISTVNHRQFSRGRSDALTVGIYGILGGLILLLTQ